MAIQHIIEPISAKVSRRSFLTGTAGLTFSFAFAATGLTEIGAALGATKAGKLNAYVFIATDGTITIMAPAAEMGQGVMTSLPLIVAEELDADWNKVKVVQAPVAKAYAHGIFRGQHTVASLTTVGYWMPLRTAGAQARRVLIDAVAARWNVPATELTTEPSMVIHAKSGRKISYGDIAAFADVPAKMPEIDPKDFKSQSTYRLLGKDAQRVDIPGKTNGTAMYGIDVRVPGMLYAAVLRAPINGTRPEKYNLEAVKKIAGVEDVIKLPDAVAVVGTSVEATKKGRESLEVKWSAGAPAEKLTTDKVMAEYLVAMRDVSKTGVTWREKGNVDQRLSGAAKVVTAEYQTAHYYHAQMEPMNCTASVQGEKCDIWVGTQAQTGAVRAAAKVLGTKPENIILHEQLLGGGFGRRAQVEYVVDAVLLSKAVGKPVKVIFSREEDIAAGRFRPVTAQKVEIGLDGAGKVIGVRQRVVAESVIAYTNPARLKASKNKDVLVMAGAELPAYEVGSFKSEHLFEKRGARLAAWRGIGAGATKFALESAIDEAAHSAGKDPLAFRLAMASSDRVKKHLDTAAQMADWGRKRDGTAVGIAVSELGNSLTVAIVEASVNRSSGLVKVHNIWQTADVGFAMQPQNVVAQMESCSIYALSQALVEQITHKDGVVEQSNFHDYPVLRMSDIPEIHTQVINSGGKIGGAGELASGTIAPALANALFTLTGKRIRSMPFTAERMLAVLKA